MCSGMGGIKQSSMLPKQCYSFSAATSSGMGTGMGMGMEMEHSRGSQHGPCVWVTAVLSMQGPKGMLPSPRPIADSEGGKKPSTRLNFVPFNTRVITTIGNLPPTQLCARINWKSVITITNNSLLAFIASKAWRNSHQQFPRHQPPSDFCFCGNFSPLQGQRRADWDPSPQALWGSPKFHLPA